MPKSKYAKYTPDFFTKEEKDTFRRCINNTWSHIAFDYLGSEVTIVPVLEVIEVCLDADRWRDCPDMAPIMEKLHSLGWFEPGWKKAVYDVFGKGKWGI